MKVGNWTRTDDDPQSLTVARREDGAFVVRMTNGKFWAASPDSSPLTNDRGIIRWSTLDEAIGEVDRLLPLGAS